MAGLRAAFARVARPVPLPGRDRQHSLWTSHISLPASFASVCVCHVPAPVPMLQLAYCICRPVLGYEEVGATDARRIGRPVQQSNMGPPNGIYSIVARSSDPTLQHLHCCACYTIIP
eukprot:scaffold3344_cov138-Isochrysis_galbana.AAC.2